MNINWVFGLNKRVECRKILNTCRGESSPQSASVCDAGPHVVCLVMVENIRCSLDLEPD